ncbi:unnamed protein product [Effrenium voratum]|uniref:Spindle pole body component n=1 Tax=Effrenium voratum TaxID=2562239 RepID=A0AA36MV40_9DINO|nr:unnamed protein product [Effrenium voratum]
MSGLELLDHVFRACQSHQASAWTLQACGRVLESKSRQDLVLLWVFHRTAQPFLDSLRAWARRGELPDAEFASGKRLRLPTFLQSVGVEDFAHKLSILGEAPISPRTDRKVTLDAFFTTAEQEQRAFLGRGSEKAPVMPSGSDSCLAVLVSAEDFRAASHQPEPAPRRVPYGPLRTALFAAPAQNAREANAANDARRAKEAAWAAEAQGEKARRQLAYRQALDEQVLEKSSASQALKRSEVEAAARERPLLDVEDRLLQAERHKLEAEHLERQRQTEQEALLLRWKLERLKLAPKLRQVFAKEAEAFDRYLRGFAPNLEQPVGGPARRLEVPRMWGPVVNPFDRTSAIQDTPMSQVGAAGSAASAELLDQELQLVRQVLRGVYSACAQPERRQAPVRLELEPPDSPDSADSADSDAARASTAAAAPPRPLQLEVDSFAEGRPALGQKAPYSRAISEDAAAAARGAVPLDASLENCLIRPLRLQSQWLDAAVARKVVLELGLARRVQLLRRYLLMGESRLLEPFLTEAILRYATLRGEEASNAEAVLDTLFQSLVPRPTKPEDDQFLSRVTLHLGSLPSPIGHGPVRLLDGIRFSLQLDFPMSLFFDRLMPQYSRLFRIIALVNHTLECLKRSWLFLASYGKMSSGALRGIASLRHGLHHFASTLHRYLLVGVVAAEFERLENKILGATSLDEILEAHRNCLGRCLAKSFLDADSQDALAAVVGILDQALQLQHVLEEADVDGAFPALRLRAIEAAFRDLRRSLKVCRPDGGIEFHVAEEDFFEAWLLCWFTRTLTGEACKDAS